VADDKADMIAEAQGTCCMLHSYIYQCFCEWMGAVINRWTSAVSHRVQSKRMTPRKISSTVPTFAPHLERMENYRDSACPEQDKM
jgi:hypothetical protein